MRLKGLASGVLLSKLTARRARSSTGVRRRNTLQRKNRKLKCPIYPVKLRRSIVSGIKSTLARVSSVNLKIRKRKRLQ